MYIKFHGKWSKERKRKDGLGSKGTIAQLDRAFGF